MSRSAALGSSGNIVLPQDSWAVIGASPGARQYSGGFCGAKKDASRGDSGYGWSGHAMNCRHFSVNNFSVKSMPITLQSELRCVSQEQFGQIAYDVMDVVFAVHNELGRFLAHSSLAALQWINITQGQVLFKTLGRE